LRAAPENKLKTRMNCQLRILLPSALLSLALQAHARCDVTATPITFGAYDVFSSTAVRSTATINVTCTTGGAQLVTVTIGPSLGSGGFSPRQMRWASGNDRLDYNLYSDAGLTQIWGDGTGVGSPVTVLVDRGRPFNGSVYGVIPARQNVSAGLYSDSLTVTINR
jgi:spore coat protein U-like protein